jgi:two-component system CheB/CheR fusion protein
MDTISVQEREVRDNEGRWYSLRVRPYLTLDNKSDGAVLMLVDIDALKQSEKEIAKSRDYAESVLLTTRSPLVVLTEDLRVHSANAAFCKTFKVSPGETEGHLIYELGNSQWNIPKLREFLEDILPRNSFFDDYEITHDYKDWTPHHAAQCPPVAGPGGGFPRKNPARHRRRDRQQADGGAGGASAVAGPEQ